jgi:hypothetical protein
LVLPLGPSLRSPAPPTCPPTREVNGREPATNVLSSGFALWEASQERNHRQSAGLPGRRRGSPSTYRRATDAYPDPTDRSATGANAMTAEGARQSAPLPIIGANPLPLVYPACRCRGCFTGCLDIVLV